MAMVAIMSPGRMQAHNHLVPVQPLAQYFREARQIAFRQRLELLHHFLAFLHGAETMDPEHDFDLHFQRQHSTKRLVFRVDQPATVHLNTTTSRRLTSVLDLPLLILFYPPITDSRSFLWVKSEKVYPWGAPPRVSSRLHTPHVRSLHQSRSRNELVKPQRALDLAHSSFVQWCCQDGELVAVNRALLCADRHPI